MFRATTPTHTFDLGTDCSALEKIVVTYQQNGETVLEKEKDDLTLNGNIASVTLTQEEANKFLAYSKVFIQVRIKTTDGSVIASEIMEMKVADVLNAEVI